MINIMNVVTPVANKHLSNSSLQLKLSFDLIL